MAVHGVRIERDVNASPAPHLVDDRGVVERCIDEVVQDLGKQSRLGFVVDAQQPVTTAGRDRDTTGLTVAANPGGT